MNVQLYQELSFEEFINLDLKNSIGYHKYVAMIGSRDIKEDVKKMHRIRNISYTLCYDQHCKIVSGGAYGPDEASMEGSINAPLFSLNSIIPMSTKNAYKFLEVFQKVSEDSPLVDTIECVVTTARLIVYYPDFRNGYNVGKYFERDKKIARTSDVVLAFWDSVSNGTKKTIDFGRKMKKQVFVVLC